MLRALAARYARQAGCTLAPTTQPRLFGTLHRRTGRTQAQEERRRSLDDVLRDTDHVELLSSLPDAPLALQLERCNALLLDVSYTPVGILGWQRAVLMSLFDKAEVLEYHDVAIRSARQSHPVPAVLKVSIYLSPSTSRLSVSRRAVMMRDASTCQYCGSAATTLDHVMPVSRGGAWSFSNLVAACARCNAKKGARTPAEAGMQLFKTPKEPSAKAAVIAKIGLLQTSLHDTPTQWTSYLT